MRAPLLALLAAALLAAAPLRAQPADPTAKIRWYEQKLEQDLNGDAAARFLNDQDFQVSLRKNRPEKLAALFRAAADLKDFGDLLRTANDAARLRMALVIRLRQEPEHGDWPAQSVFSGDPQKLIGWTATREKAATVALLREALWEWSTLNDSQRVWLTGHGATEAGWKILPFEDRAKRLAERASDMLPALLAAFPRDRRELLKLEAQKLAIEGALSAEDRQKLSAHYEKADVAIDVFEKLSQRPKVLKDPALLKQLEAARALGTVEESLTALDKIYDHIGERNGELTTVRPEKSDEQLGDAVRGNLEAMLGPAFLKEISGTTPGNLLKDFYKKKPLKLKLVDLGDNIAQYDNTEQRLEFNEKYILRWLKKTGRKSESLMKEPDFSQVVMLLATTFVHEAFHQMQHAWAEENDLPDLSGHGTEIESMEMEGVYLLEKRQSSPRYRKFTDAARQDSSVVDGDLRRAAVLHRDARAFRINIARDHYAEWPSLEAMGQGDVVSYNRMIETARKELARRGTLPEPERRRLETTWLDKNPQSTDTEEWYSNFVKLKTPVLEERLNAAIEHQADAAANYAAWRKRAEGANALTARAIREVDRKAKP